MADLIFDTVRDAADALKTEDIFSCEFQVAKTRYTLTRAEENARRNWSAKRETFRAENLDSVTKAPDIVTKLLLLPFSCLHGLGST
jgi:hypothetical protein